jgi:hypothetical protein
MSGILNWFDLTQEETKMRSLRHLSVIFLAAIFAQAVAAQELGSLFDRLREIKFLETDRVQVHQILHDFHLDRSSDTSDEFTFGKFSIDIKYSTGDCKEDEEGGGYVGFFEFEKTAIWDVAEGTVVGILITGDDMTRKDLGIDLSKLKKEQVFNNADTQFIYHDKKRGFAVEVSEDGIEQVILFPSVSTNAKTCSTKFAKEFVSMESWFGSVKLEKRKGYVHLNQYANVTNLDLSHRTVTATGSRRIEVRTSTFDPENDPLLYVYHVSGGRIIGNGPKVVWDLSGMPPGTYTITVGVDDGCGICGQTVTKTVTIK